MKFLFRRYIRGLLKEKAERRTAHMHAIALQDAIVDKLESFGIFGRGIPLPIINRVENFTEEIMADVYRSRSAIASADDDGFGKP